MNDIEKQVREALDKALAEGVKVKESLVAKFGKYAVNVAFGAAIVLVFLAFGKGVGC